MRDRSTEGGQAQFQEGGQNLAGCSLSSVLRHNIQRVIGGHDLSVMLAISGTRQTP